MLYVAFISILLSFTVQAANTAYEMDMGVIGDSAITGAVADTSLQPTYPSLLSKLGSFLFAPLMDDNILVKDVFKLAPFAIPKPSSLDLGTAMQEFNLERTLPLPTRVYFSNSERSADDSNLVDLNASARGSMQIDLLQYSFPYFVGHGLGLTAERIVYAAQDGQRIESISRQFERIMSVKEIHMRNYLPRWILISYTANDFCRQDVFSANPTLLTSDYSASIIDQLQQAQQKYRPHPLGTKVILMAPFSVPQLISNPKLLGKKIRFYDNTTLVKCEDLRGSNFKALTGKFQVKLVQALQGMCSSILKSDPNDPNTTSFFTKLFDNIVDIQATATRKLNTFAKPGWEFIHFRKNYDFNLESTDLSNDCFHPGLNLHIKVARELLRDLRMY